jgi:demethylmenaquinone methyltransferase/2-methoxy-6-polyprenyl-1,4-benzoquinol methylase
MPPGKGNARASRATTANARQETPMSDTPQEQSGVLRVFNTREETRHYYNKISKVYDLMAEHSEGPMRERGLELFAARSGEKVLEVGFGTGHSLVTLAKSVGPTGKVHGIDLSDAMVEIAKENLTREGLGDRAEVTQGDGLRLRYESDSLDGVFMSFTLELFDTPEIPVFLAECRRVLKPGGRIAVVGMSSEGEHGVVFHLYEWTHRHFPNLVDCRPIFVQQALKAAGFSIRHAEVQSMWVPVEIVLGVK